MNRISLVFLTALALALHPAATLAQEIAPVDNQTAEQSPLEARAEQTVAVLNGEIVPEAFFSDSFLASVSSERFTAITEQLTSQFGAALAVESLEPVSDGQASLAIRMERAIARSSIAIEPGGENRVTGLLFRTFEPVNDTPAKISDDLKALPGDVSWWFGPINDGAPVMASEWGDHMPIGSTMKLYVLATLARQVAMDERSWDEVVTLPEARSFPSGVMQDWPDGAPVTLHTLASLMISISDNSATDVLIKTLGRDLVYETMVDSGHSAPELNDPLLTTRDLFLLKAGPEGRLSAYQRGNADVRRQILAGIDDIELGFNEVEAAFLQGPNALDVEWFASAADLVNLLRMMRDVGDPEAFAIMAINSGVTPTVRNKWSYVGYKGGSEPGVYNLTYLLTDQAGRDYALVLSWRNEAANVDGTALDLIAQRILSLSL